MKRFMLNTIYFYGAMMSLSPVSAFNLIMVHVPVVKKEWTASQTLSVLNHLSLSSFISLSVLLSSPVSSVAADITRGSEIFNGNCAGCHAGGMNFITEKKTLKKEALEKYIASPLDQPTLQSWVMNSGQHKNLVFMRAPSGNGKLTEMDWNDVTALIYNNAMEDKW